LVASTRQSGKKHFKLMKRGEDELRGVGLEPILVDPDKPFSSIRKFEGGLEVLEGDVRICDTYVSSRTLDYVAQIAKAASIKLLTENIQDSSRLKRDLVAFATEHAAPIEVRVSPPGHLHDRYILHRDGMLIIGASLKDMGKKQSVVIPLSCAIAAEISRAFDREWGRASKLL
jgi:hypothetical protein